MALTNKELTKVAEQIASSLHKMFKQNGGFSSDSTIGEGRISSNKARPSRKKDIDDDSETPNIKRLEKLSTTSRALAKRMEENIKDWRRVLKGSALEDAHDQFVDELRELAKNIRNENAAAGKTIKGYTDFVEQNKGNFAKLQEGQDMLDKYTSQVSRLYNELQKVDDEGKPKQDTKAIRNIERQISTSVNNLKTKLGIEVNELKTYRNVAKGKRELQTKDRAYAVAIMNANEKLLSTNNEFVKNLSQLHEEEIDARAKLIKSLGTAVLASSQNILGTIESKLQNLQLETQFTKAFQMGMSGSELSAIMQENRQAANLLGASFSDYLSASSDNLKQFGLIGKAAADQATKLSNIQMQIGVEPNKQSSGDLQNSIAGFMALTGANMENATAIMAERSGSAEFASAVLARNDKDAMKVAHEQLFEMTRIAKSSGRSAEFSHELLKEQRAARFKDFVEKIQKTVMLDVAIDKMNDLLPEGKKITDNERLALKQIQAGGIESVGKELLPFVTTARDKLGGFFEKSSGIVSAGIVNMRDKGLSSDVSTYGIVEKLFDITDINRKALADEYVIAERAKETIGKAAGEFDFEKWLEGFQKGFGAVDKIYLEGKEIIMGAAASPLGAFAGFAGDVAAIAIGNVIASKGLGILSKSTGLLSKVFSKLPPVLTTAATSTAAVGGKPTISPTALKGTLGVGLLGVGLEYLGSSMKDDAIAERTEPRTSILDKETLGASASVLGSTASFAATGATIGAYFGGVGAVPGAVIGGLVGAARGLYDNFDTLTDNFNIMFGDTSSSIKDLEHKIHMQSGNQIDANGNIIPPQQPKTDEYLKNIQEDISEIRGTTTEAVSKAEDERNLQRAESQYAASRSNEARARARAAMENNDATSKINSAMLSIDTAFS